MEGKKQAILNIFESCTVAEQKQLAMWMSDFSTSHLDRIHEQTVEDLADLGMLIAVRDDLKKMFPMEEEMWEEQLNYPKGEAKEDTIHVDAFLYDNLDLEMACQEWGFTRYKCLDCDDSNVKELDVITHSMTTAQMLYIYKYMLPYVHEVTIEDCAANTKKPCLVDIGSRVGAMLYGAQWLGRIFDEENIIGIELEEVYADAAESICHSYVNLGYDIQVIQDDVLNCADKLKLATHVVMNNVFEYFADTKKQRKLWNFCLKEFRKNTGLILITVPSLKDSLKELKISEDYHSFLVEIEVRRSLKESFERVRKRDKLMLTEDDGEIDSIHVYYVKSPSTRL